MSRGRITSAGRLLCAVALAAGLSTAPPSWPALAVCLGVATLSVVAARGASGGGGREGTSLRLLLPVGLVAALAVLPLAWTGDAALAGRLALRALASTMAVVAVLSGIPRGELGGALSSLGIPEALAGAVSASLRQIGVLGDEGRRLLLARRLRGAIHARDGALLLGAWLARTAERAERVELSMSLRGHSILRSRVDAGPRAWDLAPISLAGLAGAAAHFAHRTWP